MKKLRGVLEKWIVDTDDKGRRLETLDELKAEPRFIPARDWRPPPGTPEAAQAAALKAAAKDNPSPASAEPVKKKKRKQKQ